MTPLISIAHTFSAWPSALSTKQMLGMLDAWLPRATTILQFRALRGTLGLVLSLLLQQSQNSRTSFDFF